MSPTNGTGLDWPIVDDDWATRWGRYVIAKPTKRQLAEAQDDGVVQVKHDEQRGVDPVSQLEVKSERKMRNWAEYDMAGNLFIGQLNYALHTERGTTFEIIHGDDGHRRIQVNGAALMADGRQRSYTVRKSVEHVDQFGHETYDPEETVQVVIWLEADSDTRKEIFAQLNLGRGGDPASKSAVRWMAPEGELQQTARRFVERSPHLGQDNVNVVTDSVRKGDHRLAGFHTFVKALETAWGNRRLPTPQETEELLDFLVRFYDKLVEVRPEMGVVSLGTRQKAREEFVTGSPLFLYGAMQIAVDLFHEEGPYADLRGLEAFEGDEGDAFLSLSNDEWKQWGVMLPHFDPWKNEVTSYRIANSLPSRRAMAQAIRQRFKDQLESDEVPA